MANENNGDRQQAHLFIERLAPSQVSTVVGLLEAMLDPVSGAVANAPIDDEAESEEERQAVAESKAWFERHDRQGGSQDELLSEFGVTSQQQSPQTERLRSGQDFLVRSDRAREAEVRALERVCRHAKILRAALLQIQRKHG